MKSLCFQHVWTLAFLSSLGWAASIPSQTADRPVAKLFGIAPARPAPMPAPLLEDSNRLIEILVELAWFEDPVTFPFFLEARVEGPSLKVRGNVPSQAVRERALQLAKKNSPLLLADNLKINSNLTFRPVRATTEQLQNFARACLRESLPRQAKNLQTRSSADGRVAVIGKVDSFEEKLVISQALRRLHSCTAVVNLVKVASDPDGQVARGIAQNLPVTGTFALPGPSASEFNPLVDTKTIPPGQLTAREGSPLPPELANPPTPADVQWTAPAGGGKSPVELSLQNVNTPRAPNPVQSDVQRLDLGQLKKRLGELFPTAKDIRVFITPTGKLAVEFRARTDAEGQQMFDRALTLPELQNLWRVGNLELAYSPP